MVKEVLKNIVIIVAICICSAVIFHCRFDYSLLAYTSFFIGICVYILGGVLYFVMCSFGKSEETLVEMNRFMSRFFLFYMIIANLIAYSYFQSWVNYYGTVEKVFFALFAVCLIALVMVAASSLAIQMRYASGMGVILKRIVLIAVIFVVQIGVIKVMSVSENTKYFKIIKVSGEKGICYIYTKDENDKDIKIQCDKDIKENVEVGKYYAVSYRCFRYDKSQGVLGKIYGDNFISDNRVYRASKK